MSKKRTSPIRPALTGGPDDSDHKYPFMNLDVVPQEIHNGYDGTVDCEHVLKVSETEIHVVFSKHRDIWKFQADHWNKT